MSAKPIIDAIDAGHFQRTVTIAEAKLHKDWRAGQDRCRADDHLFPCPTILAARREAGPVQSMVKVARPFADVATMSKRS